MNRKNQIDATGAVLLVGFSMVLGLNQVMIKVVNDGIQPVFQAGLRSACAMVLIFVWARYRGVKLDLNDGSFWPGILVGLLFSTEFIFLFMALDLTTVARVSVLFYSMPVWLTIAAHFLIPGETLTRRRALGLVFAVCGVGLALLRRDQDSEGHLIGDLLCIVAAMFWAAIALLARMTSLSKSPPEMQLLYQLVVSAVVVLPLSLLFGELIRDLTPVHIGIFAVQVILVVSIGFLMWFWVLSIYPASDMASFGFLAPVFGVLFGWLLLAEPVSGSIVIALALVSIGIVLINYQSRPR